MKLLPIIIALILAACAESPTEQGTVSGQTNDGYFPLPDQPGEVVNSEEQNFYVQTVVEGLSIPWGIAFLPDGRALITEREGRLRITQNGQLLPDAVSGVPEVYAQGQGGLLDVAVHPDYENNGWIYLTYSDPGGEGAHTALMRARLTEDSSSLADQEVLLSLEPKTSGGAHFGSRIVFQDGYVYFSTGDRGQMNMAQDLSTHNGSLLRLHEDGRVPDDNPFVDEPNARPEIYTYGNRNIQGMDIHPETGAIWTHEHGPRGGDEINIMEAGLNYGWPEISYGINYDGTVITEDTARDGMESPLHQWTPSIAPSGMAFIRGDRYPGWTNNLMVGALAFQKVNRVVLDGDGVVHEEALLDQEGRVRDVKMGPDGYLYVANETHGTILRLVPVE